MIWWILGSVVVFFAVVIGTVFWLARNAEEGSD